MPEEARRPGGGGGGGDAATSFTFKDVERGARWAGAIAEAEARKTSAVEYETGFPAAFAAAHGNSGGSGASQTSGPEYAVPIQRGPAPALDGDNYVTGHDLASGAVPPPATAEGAGALYTPLHGFRDTHDGSAPDPVAYQVLDGEQSAYGTAQPVESASQA